MLRRGRSGRSGVDGPAQLQKIVAASFAAGGSINEVAQRFGIRQNLLTGWRRREAREIAAVQPKKWARFAAVRIKAVATDGTIEVEGIFDTIRANFNCSHELKNAVTEFEHRARGLIITRYA